MNGRTNWKGLAKGTPDRSGAVTWRARHGWAASGGWRRSEAGAGGRLGGGGRSSRTNDRRAHRTLHTHTHHKHALRLQKWRSTSRALPRCVVDYGFLLRRKVLGGHVRISHSLRCLQCDNSYQGSALCLLSNEVIRQGRTETGLRDSCSFALLAHWSTQSSSSCSTTKQVAHQEFSSSRLQGIKQAWAQSIRIIRGSACGPVGCVYTLGQTLCTLIITINRMHESTRHLTAEEITPVHGAIRTEQAGLAKSVTLH